MPKRVRNELRFRKLTVSSKTLVADNFWRIEFTSEELDGYNSPGFDDHSKIFSLTHRPASCYCHR